MSISDDACPDLLISRLAGPLAPDARRAFRVAAEDALARVPCWGEGAAYRAVAALQRAYFDPPAVHPTGWDSGREPRSKLLAAPGLEHGRDRRATRVQAYWLAVAYWSVARLALNQERLALHCLGLAGFETYLPRLRERRVVRGRWVERQPPLFPGYAFIVIELQWHAARWAPGTLGLVMDGTVPARVPDVVIAELRARERGGLIELPKPRGFRRGDQVRIVRGPFREHIALYAGMSGRERVAVLLQLLGAQQRTELPADAIELIK